MIALDRNAGKNYVWPEDPKFKGCSQFSALFQDMSVLSILMESGYQMPRSHNYMHRCNWLRYETNSNSHDSYFIVMVLTVPTVLSRAQIFNPRASLNTNITAMDISGVSTAKAIIAETCSTEPSVPPKGNYKNYPRRYECVWPFEGVDGHSGRYYMGDYLKSISNRW